MRVSDLTIKALNPYVTGGGSPSPYMSGPDLVKFFNAFGCNDEYRHQNGGLPNAWPRNEYSYERLNQLNGTYEFKHLLEALADARKVGSPDEIAAQIREFIKHDGYGFEKDEAGIYRAKGGELDDPVIIEAHFQEIKNRILECIRSAKFSIWVAVAWFTDKDLANELRHKHRQGINVQVVVNDDEITDLHGLDFSSRNIEFHKVSPSSKWGKKIMHNKFCIIDLKTVIHGSFNWTSNANYNKESITITESRELAEEFSCEFIQLKLAKNT